MKKPYNWNNLIDSFDDCNCPYAYIVGYYLSRFDRDAYKKLGFGNMTETHEKIGSVLEISSNTLKNFRDAFDPYHENKCIEYYGTGCYVCGFNFEDIFGDIGTGFIHVHHLIPLSEINQEY